MGACRHCGRLCEDPHDLYICQKCDCYDGVLYLPDDIDPVWCKCACHTPEVEE